MFSRCAVLRACIVASRATIRAYPHQSRILRSSLAIHPRRYSTPPAQLTTSELAPERYHELSDSTMDSLLEQLEMLLDGHGDAGYEVEYSAGVLTLSLGSNGTYVINKQPPNKQIWLSSPVSGPKRYDYVLSSHSWRYSRDNMNLGELLSTELSDIFKDEIVINTNPED